jgi:nifR3 family TIM-barrel protein
MTPQPALTEPFRIADVELPNRVLLAPLAGIGNWFVRLQAQRHGAGLAVSEMVSSFAIAHRNRRTVDEMLRVHPDEGPVSIQLFGADPDVMREAAAVAAAAGPALIDLNMGCPVPKVLKTGAGAALIRDPELAVAVARAAREGSGLPVTVKVRSGIEPGDHSGVELARRLVADAGVAAVALHPRPAKQFHRGRPEYALVAELGKMLERDGTRVPLIVSGGLRSTAQVRRAYAESGADAVMIARGSLGNPWIFDELTSGEDLEPSAAEIEAELRWVLDRALEHWGSERAARNLRKFYPWYVERLGYESRDADRFQRTETLDEVRELLDQGPSASADAGLLSRLGTPL